MSKLSNNQQNYVEMHDKADKSEYQEMDLLERLETLREDMEDLGISTLAELIHRIDAIHQKLDNRQ